MDTKTIVCEMKLTEKQRDFIKQSVKDACQLGKEGKTVTNVFFEQGKVFLVME